MSQCGNNGDAKINILKLDFKFNVNTHFNSILLSGNLVSKEDQNILRFKQDLKI